MEKLIVKNIIMICLFLLFSGCESSMKSMDIKSPEENFKKNVEEQDNKFKETLKSLKDKKNSKYYNNIEEYK